MGAVRLEWGGGGAQGPKAGKDATGRVYVHGWRRQRRQGALSGWRARDTDVSYLVILLVVVVVVSR